MQQSGRPRGPAARTARTAPSGLGQRQALEVLDRVGDEQRHAGLPVRRLGRRRGGRRAADLDLAAEAQLGDEVGVAQVPLLGAVQRPGTGRRCRGRRRRSGSGRCGGGRRRTRSHRWHTRCASRAAQRQSMAFYDWGLLSTGHSTIRTGPASLQTGSDWAGGRLGARGLLPGCLVGLSSGARTC